MKRMVKDLETLQKAEGDLVAVTGKSVESILRPIDRSMEFDLVQDESDGERTEGKSQS